MVDEHDVCWIGPSLLLRASRQDAELFHPLHLTAAIGEVSSKFVMFSNGGQSYGDTLGYT